MYTLLLVALLLALLFDTAAASSPTIDPIVPVAPMGSFYPDPDGILNAVFFCEHCDLLVDYCMHFMNPPLPQRAPTFTPATFYEHPEWPEGPQPIFDDLEPQPSPTLPYFPDADRQPLRDAVVRHLDDNATTVRPDTVQHHVEDIYTPGDRTQEARTESRRAPNRRQAPRPGGFPCTVEGCGKLFDRSCDLKRHQKTHLGRNERPHKCAVCNEGFLYPKDRDRHQRTHDQSASSRSPLFCSVPGCASVHSFSRRDNLLRHQRKQHPHLIVSS